MPFDPSDPQGPRPGDNPVVRLSKELSTLRSEVEGLRGLLEISRELSSILDRDALLDAILDSAIKLTRAKRGMLLSLTDGRLKVILGRGSEQVSLDPETSQVSETLTHRCIEENKVIPYDNLSALTEYRDVRSIKALSLYAAVCVPLRERGVPSGVLYLDSSTPGLRTSPNEIVLLEAFASQAAISLLNARLMRTSEESRLLLARENTGLRAGARASNRMGNMLGQSRVIHQVFDKISLLKDAQVPVLILGESGTGKELVARALHYEGVHRDGPFVPVNCAGLPGDLLDSLMFGHRKGAFTGAISDMPGLVEQSEGGTLFLDEIGDMPATLQVKLLRFLEAGEFRRVGEVDLRTAHCRVVSATNQDLAHMVRERTFREDLYFRLAGVCLEIPPLRERPEDIPVLVEHFFAQALEHTPRRVAGLTDAAREYLLHHSWPGNVRQLRQAVEGACALVPEGKPVGVEHLETLFPRFGKGPGQAREPGSSSWNSSADGTAPGAGSPGGSGSAWPAGLRSGPDAEWEAGPESATEAGTSSPAGGEAGSAGPEPGRRTGTGPRERDVLLSILERHDWNMTRAAQEIGISRQHLYNRIRLYNLKRPSGE